MPRTDLSVNTLDRTTGLKVHALSLSWVQADAASGNKFVNNGKTFLVALNSHAATARNVTVTVQPTTAQTADGATITSPAVSVVAQTVHILGPYPAATYNDTNGECYVDAATDDIYYVVISL